MYISAGVCVEQGISREWPLESDAFMREYKKSCQMLKMMARGLDPSCCKLFMHGCIWSSIHPPIYSFIHLLSYKDKSIQAWPVVFKNKLIILLLFSSSSYYHQQQ